MNPVTCGRGVHGELRAAGLAALLALARRSGLPTAAPRVLSDRANLVVHLAPAPVVARVPLLAGRVRRDPTAWLRRELAVAAHVAARGGPVVAPSAVVDPGPHAEAGFAATFWEHAATRDEQPDPATAGVALAHLHAAAEGLPDELPWLAPAVEQVHDALAACPAEIADGLRKRHESLVSAVDRSGGAVLHGDAHAGNLLLTGAGPRWTDLEETCTGPREWDLAVLADPRAISAYAAELGRPAPSRDDLEPYRALRELEGTAWLTAVAPLYPERYAALAQQRLSRLTRP
ncbi:MAG: aminoglycoside phosphotransferase family protein [Pseudonocardia sp.]|nr:aminoglycoside phosphotransferase family protein [Pseudonocardia sp.]